jgi:hypothetical protein
MDPSTSRRRWIDRAAAAAIAAAVAGCASPTPSIVLDPPPGFVIICPLPRDSQVHLGQPLSARALDEFMADCSAMLVRQINSFDLVRSSAGQNVLVIYPVAAAGLPDPKPNLSAIRVSVVADESIRRNFVVLTSGEYESNVAASRVLLCDPREVADAAEPDVYAYDPRSVYRVLSKLTRTVDRGDGTCTYTLTVDFLHVQTRQAVTHARFSKTFAWDTGTREWAMKS